MLILLTFLSFEINKIPADTLGLCRQAEPPLRVAFLLAEREGFACFAGPIAAKPSTGRFCYALFESSFTFRQMKTTLRGWHSFGGEGGIRLLCRSYRCKTVHWTLLPRSVRILSSIKKPPKWAAFLLAEREGFEPSCACAQTDFESAPL